MSQGNLVAVLIGKAGVGKTTFYNQLCETDHVATYSSKSLTRQLHRSEVVQGGSRFTVIDTAATDSKDEVFKHSWLLKEALTCEPVNALFVLVQFNDRCDSSFEEFDKTISYVKPEYHDMVIVVVSKFDLAPREHVKKIEADYKEGFKEEGFNKIMFHSNQENVTTVAGKMLGLMNGMSKRQLVYEEGDFLKYFRIADESRAQKKVVQALEKEVDEILNSYSSTLQSLGSGEDRDGLITCAISSSRYEVDQVYDRFCVEFGPRMVDLDSYTVAITLQKKIENAHRKFRESAKELMSYNPDDATDWRNSIRKCQFCGQVWVKVSGCTGKTTCGNRESAKDSAAKPWLQYIFSRGANGKLTFRRQHPDSSESSRPTSSSSFTPSRGPEPKGCGRIIVWSAQPRVSEAELGKFFEVKDLENIIMEMQQRPGFESAMKSYVGTIDTSFYR